MTNFDFSSWVYKKPLCELLDSWPIANDFLTNLRLSDLPSDVPFDQALSQADPLTLEEFDLTQDDVIRSFREFMDYFSRNNSEDSSVNSITIVGGMDKTGDPENVRLTIHKGDIISIVGPTGSGKSRLLSDIECLAQGDTPTGRTILVDGLPVDNSKRFSMEGKLVAQLSQNMNYVMDLTVSEFLEMHANSRFSPDYQKTIEKCFACANRLSGEPFSMGIKVTQLSGGQSRALMIADTIYLSDSPIVLIDEIENAGINRRQAVELLARENKIILIATHDPLLALSASQRIVIRNGGISKVIETAPHEREIMSEIEQIDTMLMRIRQALRDGKVIPSFHSV